jgi:WD40 repeat protein
MKNLYSEAIDKSICFFNNGKDLIIGGFYDGKIILTNFSKKEDNQIEIIPFKDEKPILSIEIDKEEKFLFIGNSIGNVLVYKINQDNKNDWEKHCLLTDQNSSISHIKCNDELNVWASLSNDGCICLYTLPSCKLIRCIKAPPKNYSYIFLSDSPLPCIVLLSDEDNTEILVYSINGKLIFKRNEYNKILCPMIIKDIYSYDYLAYIGNDHVNILSLPKLEVEVTINNLNEINYICVSEDKKTLYAINKDGTETFIIKEEVKKGLSFQNKTSSLYNVKII